MNRARRIPSSPLYRYVVTIPYSIYPRSFYPALNRGLFFYFPLLPLRCLSGTMLTRTQNLPPLAQPTVRNAGHPRGGKKKRGKMTTYGRGKKRHDQQNRNARQQPLPQPQQRSLELPDAEETEYDGGPLVRPGEGLVIDWHEQAWQAVFDGASAGGRQGMRTFSDLPTLEDAALDAKRKQRQLRKKNGISLDECLDEFEKEEILSEQDTWYCPRCKEHRRASKKFDIWKTPDILVVHLKRFSSSTYRRDKLDVHVDFPIENLDLTERVVDKEDGKQEIYDLIAVDDHWGGLGGGHYTAFAKNFIDGRWYEYNGKSLVEPLVKAHYADER
jgi:ubiquitin carboxyl-terminal hydrolase 4/11/15